MFFFSFCCFPFFFFHCFCDGDLFVFCCFSSDCVLFFLVWLFFLFFDLVLLLVSVTGYLVFFFMLVFCVSVGEVFLFFAFSLSGYVACGSGILLVFFGGSQKVGSPYLAFF